MSPNRRSNDVYVIDPETLVVIDRFRVGCRLAFRSRRPDPQPDQGRHRLALQTIENRVRLSERIGQFMN